MVQSCYENLCMSKSIACERSAILTCQKSTACNRVAMVMGSVSSRGGSQEVTKPTTII